MDSTVEEVLSRIRSLTPGQLRQETAEAGLKCGPITPTTRAVLERRLARALLERGGAYRSPAPHEDLSGGGSGPGPDLASPEAGRSPVPREEAQESHAGSAPVYYGVRAQGEEPPGQRGEEPPGQRVCVYVDRRKALEAVASAQGSRFKAFSTPEEAERFAKGSDEHALPPSPSARSQDGTRGGLDSDTGRPVSGEAPAGNPERANDFPRPRPQDLSSRLRRAVEQGDLEAFSSLVWDNPRYLVGSGDNPTIVHEGCHYNVLHVAAREDQAGSVRLVLDTLEDPAFMRLVYPEDQEAMLYQRTRYLVDLYLNTPDKLNNETPLHFACKFGCPDVVNVLCSHPATDKHRRNRDGQTPCSVVCERKNKTLKVKKTIRDYLEDRCYVPLLRDSDNSSQPVIGLPWSPGPLELDSHWSPRPLELDSHWLGCGASGSPIDPVMSVRAYVGPLSPSKAEAFYRLWRAPPRAQQHFHHILKSDPDRGAERVGREMARDLGHPWAEYWSFLHCFVDLTSSEGLSRLDRHLDQNQDRSEVQGRASPLVERSPQSPVCNLLWEFERASVLDREGAEEEEESSTSSEEYLTADEGSESGLGSAGSGSGLEGSGDHRRDRSCSVSSCSSYQSTEDTSETSALMTDPPTRPSVFIQGQSPTQLDLQVLAVVEHLEMDPERFPCISRWRNNVLRFSPSERQRWPSSPMERRVKEAQNGAPYRLRSPWPPGQSRPTHTHTHNRP